MFAFYRAFIGPSLRDSSSPYYYNWSGINLDGALGNIGAMTLGTGVTSGSTVIVLPGGASLPSNGGVWVGANASGETWEYVAYASNSGGTLGTLQRTVDPEVNQVHTAGAPVYFWYPVSITEFGADFSLDDKYATSYWSANLSGVQVPRSAIRNNHLCVVQYRPTPVAAWRNFIVGWLATPDFTDDSQRTGEWTCKILSSADIAAMVEIDRTRVGDRNVARDSSAFALSELSTPYKERYSGDFAAAIPDVSAGSARDGDASTPWIAEHVAGTPLGTTKSADTMQPGEVMLTQLHLSKASGEPDGYRWIELTIVATGNQPDVLLISGSGAVQGVGLAGSYTAGEQVIICEDDVLFKRQNPLCEATVLDLDDSTFFNALNVNSDSIGVWFDTDFNDGWLSIIKWGSPTPPDPDAGVGKEDPPFWSGATVPAPTLGRTLRYTWANSGVPANNWACDYNDHAGYRYSVHPVDDGVWLGLELPGMGLKLKGDLTSSFTGVITIADDSGETTGGLDPSGVIQIGDEQIAYNNRTEKTINLLTRGYNGTTAAAHVADDLVLIIDSGVATDAPPINKIVWRRREGATNYPVDFVLKRSRLFTPRDPGDSNYDADYEQFISITGHNSREYVRPLTTTRRMKKLLLFIKKMVVNPSRPRIDELEAYLDPAYYDDDWLPNGQSVAAILTNLLLQAQVPIGAITATDDGAHNLSDFDTEKGRAWRIIADLCDYAGYKATVMPDSKIVCAPNGFWATSASTPTKVWNRQNARRARAVLSNDGANSIKQASVEWETADKSAKGTEIYPSSTDWRGSVVELGPLIFANAAAAQLAARKIYFLSRIPYTYVVDAVMGDLTLLPGQIHRIDWQFGHDTHGEMSRTCIVQSVNHRFKNHTIETTVSLLQIDREVAN